MRYGYKQTNKKKTERVRQGITVSEEWWGKVMAWGKVLEKGSEKWS